VKNVELQLGAGSAGRRVALRTNVKQDIKLPPLGQNESREYCVPLGVLVHEHFGGPPDLGDPPIVVLHVRSTTKTWSKRGPRLLTDIRSFVERASDETGNEGMT